MLSLQWRAQLEADKQHSKATDNQLYHNNNNSQYFLL